MPIDAGGSPSHLETRNFYTHETDLYNEDGPKLHMVSLNVPCLRLRCPTSDDATALLGLFADQRNVQYDKSCDGLNSVEAIDALITQWRTFSHPLERANVVVVIDGKTVGTSGIGWIGKRKSDGKMIGDAGIMLDSDFRGKGYAYEALRIVIDHAFRVLGMDEVHIACVNANVAFKGMMNTKFGFIAAPIQDKQFGNEWIWRITREQWFGSPHSA